MPVTIPPVESTASDANGTSRLPTHLNTLNGITIIAAFLPMIGAMRPAMAAAPGATTTPSRNDQIMTGIGGTFLGEALFRLSNLMLEHGGASPPLWREIGAAALSPSAGFNRLGLGYAAVGTTRGDVTERDFHYGVAPQALISTRLIFARNR